MLRLIPILFLCGLLYAQSPASWWQQADSSQKAFAAKCYEFGKQYGRGHTLAAIAWMESSLGKDTNHDESSFGAFGISENTGKKYSETFGPNVDFEGYARIALDVFTDNIEYFRKRGYNPREAYFWAYPRYNAGKNWRKFKRRGEVFRLRVRFLVTQFK